MWRIWNRELKIFQSNTLNHLSKPRGLGILTCFITWNCFSLSFKASIVGGKLSSPTRSWNAFSWLVNHSENSRNSSSYCFFFVLGDFFSPLGGVLNSRAGDADVLLGGVPLVSFTSGFLTSLGVVGVEAKTGFSFSGTMDSSTGCLEGDWTSETKTPKAFSFLSRFCRIVRIRPQRLFKSDRRAFLWGLAPLEDSLFKKSWRHSWMMEWLCRNCVGNKKLSVGQYIWQIRARKRTFLHSL